MLTGGEPGGLEDGKGGLDVEPIGLRKGIGAGGGAWAAGICGGGAGTGATGLSVRIGVGGCTGVVGCTGVGGCPNDDGAGVGLTGAGLAGAVWTGGGVTARGAVGAAGVIEREGAGDSALAEPTEKANPFPRSLNGLLISSGISICF